MINLKKEFAPRKRKIYSLSRKEKRSKKFYSEVNEERIYSTIKVTTDCTSIIL